MSRWLSLLAAFLVAASTASAETPPPRPAAPAIATRSSAETFRPLAPGETRFLGPTSAPFVASVPAAGVIEVSTASSPAPRVISLSSAHGGDDAWTDTVVVASRRPDSSPIDVILTGAVVRIALEHP